MSMKFDRLFEQDFKIVENKKKVFIPPLVIVAIAIVAAIIFHFAAGSAFNLGMDFTGGYSVSVTLGNKLTDETYAEYRELAIGVAEGLTDEEGNRYGIKIDSVQRQGNADEAGLLLKYKAVGSESEMDAVKARLKDALEQTMFFYRPEVSFASDGGSFTAEYSGLVFTENYEHDLAAKLADAGYSVSSLTVAEDRKTVSVTLGAAATEDDKAGIVEAMTVSDLYGGIVSEGSQTGSTVSGEILKTTLLAISIALLCMLVYIVIRFELLSGIAAVLALFHDILIMFCCMAIFHIEINSTFIAALITILGYSINNTIIIFDRVRENMRLYSGKRLNGKLVKPAYIANRSVQETVWRSINTTLTTLITVAMLAIIGVDDIRVFVLPIIFGLLAGTYSSIFLAPTIWAMLAKAFPGSIKVKAPKAKRVAAKAEK